MKEDEKNAILNGSTALGIEFGSTRIKAVLVDGNNTPLAFGTHDWENKFENGLWTYHLDDIWKGLQDSYLNLAKDVKEKYGVVLNKVGAIGVSAMMHGYMVFDENDELLVPFRTWRNNNAAQAADLLTEEFSFHIPARWSVAHLYQAILNGEEHVRNIRFQTTLEGYIHWMLTGEKVLGVGEASGMFPVDGHSKCYEPNAVKKFNELIKPYGLPYTIEDIMPCILVAGEPAGLLTKRGASLLDPTGQLQEGIPFAPPEGDAGTGMVATNAVKPRTGNVSAGTSVFAMIVLEKELKKAHPEIDLVTTPVGDPVAMVHCNNGTSDLNAWVNLFGEFAELLGADVERDALFKLLYQHALTGDKDGGGLLAYNYTSNEHITQVREGRPTFVRTNEGKFSLANVMRTNLYASLATLKIGCDILLKDEGVALDRITGHGGLFKTEKVGQSLLAAAINAPVTVMKTANEGGAWGMAVLANYLLNGKDKALDRYLQEDVFEAQEGVTIAPDPEDILGFEKFLKRYRDGLPIVRQAVESLK